MRAFSHLVEVSLILLVLQLALQAVSLYRQLLQTVTQTVALNKMTSLYYTYYEAFCDTFFVTARLWFVLYNVLSTQVE